MNLFYYMLIFILIVFVINRWTFWMGLKVELLKVDNELAKSLKDRALFVKNIKAIEANILDNNLSYLSFVDAETLVNDLSLLAVDYLKIFENSVASSEQLELLNVFKEMESNYLELKHKYSMMIDTLEHSKILSIWPMRVYKTKIYQSLTKEVSLNG